MQFFVRYLGALSIALAVFSASTALKAQEYDLEALQRQSEISAEAVLNEAVSISATVTKLEVLTDILADLRSNNYSNFPREDVGQMSRRIEATIATVRDQFQAQERALNVAFLAYEAAHDKYLQALGRERAQDLIMDVIDAPVSETGQTPALDAGAQAGIVARLIAVAPCVYRSGGRPSTQSNYLCQITYSLTNETDRAVYFTSGVTERNHEWNGEKRRENVGYGRTLPAGETMTLGSACVVPHAGAVGTWSAWGTGQHRGVEPPAPDDQFSWQLDVECAA